MHARFEKRIEVSGDTPTYEHMYDFHAVEGRFLYSPAFVVNCIDTTGAGDAFNSGLAVALAEGKDILSAAKFGACAGALACTVRVRVVSQFGYARHEQRSNFRRNQGLPVIGGPDFHQQIIH